MKKLRFILCQSEDVEQQTVQHPLVLRHAFLPAGTQLLNSESLQEDGGGDELGSPLMSLYEEQTLVLQN